MHRNVNVGFSLILLWEVKRSISFRIVDKNLGIEILNPCSILETLQNFLDLMCQE